MRRVEGFYYSAYNTIFLSQIIRTVTVNVLHNVRKLRSCEFMPILFLSGYLVREWRYIKIDDLAVLRKEIHATEPWTAQWIVPFAYIWEVFDKKSHRFGSHKVVKYSTLKKFFLPIADKNNSSKERTINFITILSMFSVTIDPSHNNECVFKEADELERECLEVFS